MSGRSTCRSVGRVGDRRVALGSEILASSGSRGVRLVCGIAVCELVRAVLAGGGRMVSKVVGIDGRLVDCRQGPELGLDCRQELELGLDCRQVQVHGRLVLHNMVILEHVVVLGGVCSYQRRMGLS